MVLIVGLGNPGKKYNKTWHNIGFMVVENLRLKEKSFSPWKKSKKFQSQISKGKILDQEVLLVKPQTFMNKSGQAVKLLIKNVSLNLPNDLIVVHDDIDILLEKIKISTSKGAAGHKGVQSIINQLKTKDFIRFRIGIQPKLAKPKNVEDFVLKKLNKNEEKTIKEVAKRAIEKIEALLKEIRQPAERKNNL